MRGILAMSAALSRRITWSGAETGHATLWVACPSAPSGQGFPLLRKRSLHRPRSAKPNNKS